MVTRSRSRTPTAASSPWCSTRRLRLPTRPFRSAPPPFRLRFRRRAGPPSTGRVDPMTWFALKRAGLLLPGLVCFGLSGACSDQGAGGGTGGATGAGAGSEPERAEALAGPAQQPRAVPRRAVLVAAAREAGGASGASGGAGGTAGLGGSLGSEEPYRFRRTCLPRPARISGFGTRRSPIPGRLAEYQGRSLRSSARVAKRAFRPPRRAGHWFERAHR